jgi:hypothetical protein
MSISIKNISFYLFLLLLSCCVALLTSMYSVNFLVIGLGCLVTVALLFMTFTKVTKTLVFLGTCLIVSLFLIPNYSLGGINIRFEDYLTLFLGFASLILIHKNGLEKNGIVKAISIYLVYSLAISLMQTLFNDLSSIYFIYLAKEVQYFIYFYIMLSLTLHHEFENRFIKLFTTLSHVTVLWGIYQLISHQMFGYYGIGVISETASSQSGGAFFIITLFYMYMMESAQSKGRNFLYFILMIVSVGLTFATVSRTAIFAVVVTLFLYFNYKLITLKLRIKQIILSVYAVGFAAPVMYFTLGDFISNIMVRMARITESANERTDHWSYFMSRSDTFGTIFGNGKGFTQTITGGFTLGADSQYIRLILESGYLGTAIWGIMILSIFYLCFKNRKNSHNETLFLALLTTGFLVMGFSHEVFNVALQASLFWSVAGVLSGMIIKKSKTI